MANSLQPDGYSLDGLKLGDDGELIFHRGDDTDRPPLPSVSAVVLQAATHAAIIFPIVLG